MMSNDTKTQILDSAEQFTMRQGFDAFSYRDISEQIGIKTSSIHYHYPTKDDLAVGLVDRYITNFQAQLIELSERKGKAFAKIKELFQVIGNLSGSQRDLCLCAMLSADRYAVSEQVQGRLNEFFSQFETWVERFLKEGIADGSVNNELKPKTAAVEIVAAVEGGMLLARVRQNKTYMANVLDGILARIKS